eukprot:g6441.t1
MQDSYPWSFCENTTFKSTSLETQTRFHIVKGKTNAQSQPCEANGNSDVDVRQVIVELCAPFGIGISKEFMIKEIEPCRNAARWNEQNPDRKIVPGHRIAAVRDHLGRWLEAESLTMMQLKFLVDAHPLRAIALKLQ